MSRYWSLFILLLLWTSMVCANENTAGRLTGVWSPSEIDPVTDGLIYVFNVKYGSAPQKDRVHRVPNAMVKTNNKGEFTLELAAGTYYLSAQKKVGGNVPGPPQDGDLFSLSRNEKGEPITYTVVSGKTTDIGILRGADVYKSTIITDTEGRTAIAGVVKASDGSPLADVVVQIYATQNIKGKPDYLSHKTGKDGRYFVEVAREGTYYVTIRSAYRAGRPRNGEMYGLYGGAVAQPVTVNKQTVTKGIDIQADKFVDKRLGE